MPPRLLLTTRGRFEGLYVGQLNVCRTPVRCGSLSARGRPPGHRVPEPTSFDHGSSARFCTTPNVSVPPSLPPSVGALGSASHSPSKPKVKLPSSRRTRGMERRVGEANFCVVFASELAGFQLDQAQR
jgi:hypothetical protein